MFSLIAAVGKNNELGKNNNLIWHLPNDLKFFKEKTMNKKIIMGSNTFDSLPKLLPNRHHIILTHKNNYPDEVEVFHNIDDLLYKYNDSKEEIFIIGGASIYKEFINICDKLYLTEIDAENKDADVYFPTFNKEEYTKEILGSNEDNGIKYTHVLYKKK